MITDELPAQGLANPAVHSLRFGTPSHLTLLIWSLGVILLAPPDRSIIAGVICLAMIALIYPRSFQRLLRPRWLIFLALLLPVNLLTAGADPTWSIAGLPLSAAGLQQGALMILRVVAILMLVDGFSTAVDIAEVAGTLERFGLHGLGFSMGVAVNLLPLLRQSSASTWHSLRMRGGLRHLRWRGLQLYLVTVIANALQRAEEIALAAEVRAFSPEHARAAPLKRGQWDLPVLLAAGFSLACILLVR